LVEELATLLRERADSLVISEDGSKARRKEVRGVGSLAIGVRSTQTCLVHFRTLY